MINNPESKSSFGHAALLGVGALAIFCLGGVAAVLLLPYLQGTATAEYRQGTASGEATIPAGVSLASWSENGQGGQYVMQIIEGSALPAGARFSGVVTSDTDCDADAQGLSHCHNGIALSNGRSVTAINTHNMMINECLAP